MHIATMRYGKPAEAGSEVPSKLNVPDPAYPPAQQPPASPTLSHTVMDKVARNEGHMHAVEPL